MQKCNSEKYADYTNLDKVVPLEMTGYVTNGKIYGFSMKVDDDTEYTWGATGTQTNSVAIPGPIVGFQFKHKPNQQLAELGIIIGDPC